MYYRIVLQNDTYYAKVRGIGNTNYEEIVAYSRYGIEGIALFEIQHLIFCNRRKYKRSLRYRCGVHIKNLDVPLFIAKKYGKR